MDRGRPEGARGGAEPKGELQQLADVAAAGASGNPPLSLQGTPQPGQENAETERVQRVLESTAGRVGLERADNIG